MGLMKLEVSEIFVAIGHVLSPPIGTHAEWQPPLSWRPGSAAHDVYRAVIKLVKAYNFVSKEFDKIKVVKGALQCKSQLLNKHMPAR